MARTSAAGRTTAAGRTAATGRAAATGRTAATDGGGEGALFDGPAELPLEFDPSLPDTTGYTTVTLRTSGGTYTMAQLQTAIDDASPGTIIDIQAGQTIAGGFILKAKTNPLNKEIILRSSAWASLPAAGTRVTAADAADMPKIVANATNVQAIRTEISGSAGYYRLLGLEIAPENSGTIVNTLVDLGDGGAEQNSLALVPSHLTVERCYIHGIAGVNSKRGVGLHCSYGAVIDSLISEIHGSGFDSQGIGAWNGPGPYHIENNRLEAAAENILLGGADSSITNNILSDVVFRRNHLTKPLGWRDSVDAWTIKNLFEVKAGRRILVEGNVIENCWLSAQAYAVQFLPINQGGANTWNTISDVTFRHNICRHMMACFSFSQYTDPSTVAPARASVHDNLIYDLGNTWGEENGTLLQLAHWTDFQFENNTAVKHDLRTLRAEFEPLSGFVWRNNISCLNYPPFVLPEDEAVFGVDSAGAQTGTATLNAQYSGYVWQNNMIVQLGLISGGDSWASFYPAGETIWCLGAPAAGFTDYANDDFTLTGGSPGKNAGTDGTDVGCDHAALSAAIAGVTD